MKATWMKPLRNEKVNQMTKIVMASTADAWLIHLPGYARRHEIFTAEQLDQDSANLDDLVTSSQDPEDDCPAESKDLFLSHCLFTGIEGLGMDGEPRTALSLLYRELEKLASTRGSLEFRCSSKRGRRKESFLLLVN